MHQQVMWHIPNWSHQSHLKNTRAFLHWSRNKSQTNQLSITILYPLLMILYLHSMSLMHHQCTTLPCLFYIRKTFMLSPIPVKQGNLNLLSKCKCFSYGIYIIFEDLLTMTQALMNVLLVLVVKKACIIFDHIWLG